MKLNFKCLPCLENQVVKVAEITNARNKEVLFQKVFGRLSECDFTESNPEIIGMTFALLKEHIENADPYLEIRAYYNKLFLDMMSTFEAQINTAPDTLERAVKYAIVGNIIDFNPIHNSCMEDIMKWFEEVDNIVLTVNHLDKMKRDIIISGR